MGWEHLTAHPDSLIVWKRDQVKHVQRWSQRSLLLEFESSNSARSWTSQCCPDSEPLIFVWWWLAI